MSIVEQALEKNRAAQRSRQLRADAPSRTEETVNRAREAAAIDPAARIRPMRLPLDRAACRERRVILQDAGEEDAVPVAAYRMLRTRLLHRVRAKQWSTIAVTSAGQNDGKTLTAVNLAMSLAREKNRDIVLLDLDMRNPSVCRTLGIDPAVELRQYLETGQGGHDMFMSVCADNLLIAGSTSPTDQASELLASARFDEMLSIVRGGAVHPLVLIDLPPVLATDDALVIAHKVDAFLVVASEGYTEGADLEKAMDLLKEFPIAGIAMNRVIGSSSSYEYGYGYVDEGAAGR